MVTSPSDSLTMRASQCTFFCTTCASAQLKASSLCQHCICEHQGHQVIQVSKPLAGLMSRACLHGGHGLPFQAMWCTLCCSHDSRLMLLCSEQSWMKCCVLVSTTSMPALRAFASYNANILQGVCSIHAVVATPARASSWSPQY